MAARVPDGVHWYDAAQHALVQVAPPRPEPHHTRVTGGPWRTGGATPNALTGVPPSDSLDEVVRRRGSQLHMDRSRTLPIPLLKWPTALRGVEVPHWVVVRGVDGVTPGLYR